MNTFFYTSERNVQILISLLKENQIRKVIASPGTTNLTFIASIQNDSFFELFSSVDERSAAYLACGLSAQSGEPVVLSCTGATASRNYFSGLTEAYYRKLPILAVTSTQNEAKIGHHRAQVINRSQQPLDTVIHSEHVRSVVTEEDEWDATIRLNRAILALNHHGGGPVHINITTTYSKDFSVKELPAVRVIRRYTQNDNLPELPKGRIAVVLGNHKIFSEKETVAIDDFCAAHDAVVFCDHTSGYYGRYRVQFAVALNQADHVSNLRNLDLLIHLGEVSGDSPTFAGLRPKDVWRVSEDGELRDTFNKLINVFEMPEEVFFQHYSSNTEPAKDDFYRKCQAELDMVRANIPDLPFAHTWIASQTAHKIPKDSILHLAIYNSLRNWNFFEVDNSVIRSCNTGGFGIDGILSTLVGASLADPEKICFAVIGDLAFFYDMNVAGNRHVGRNVRILLVNNGKGTEFRNYNHPGAAFGDEADLYIAAGGHFGNKSRQLVKHYAEDLGFEYMSAESKEEYLANLDRFVTPDLTERPMMFEVFTTSEDESDSLMAIRHSVTNSTGQARKILKSIVGDKGVNIVKKIIKQ